MKYGLGIRLLISFLVGGIAILYKVNINPQTNQAEVSSVMNVPRQFLFDLLTDPVNVPAYFSWVTRLRSQDTRKVVVGKRYRGLLNLPFLGQHQISYKITDCQDGSWMVLMPEKKEESYFNTEVVLMLNSVSKTKTQFYMKIIYHRRSALFQFTLGRFLKILTDQQLARAALNVRTLAMSKWKKWSRAEESEKPKNYTVDINNGHEKYKDVPPTPPPPPPAAASPPPAAASPPPAAASPPPPTSGGNETEKIGGTETSNLSKKHVKAEL